MENSYNYINSKKTASLKTIQKSIQKSHLLLIIVITIFLCIGGALININANSKTFNQNLETTSKLISRLYDFTDNFSQDELCNYFNSIAAEHPEIDVISIVNSKNVRLYHTNNSLIGTNYDGKIPDLKNVKNGLHIFDENGPSGPQRRIYSAIYDKEKNYNGFIMTIILKTSINYSYLKTLFLFLITTVAAVLIEYSLSKTFSNLIKQKFFGYEPDIFSSMFLVRDNILESINEGIVAVDNQKQIIFSNKAAKKVLRTDDDERNFTSKFFTSTLQDGKSVFGLQEKNLYNTELLVDCIPISTEKNISGAIAILHDRTEYTKLMEDLSGTKYLVDSMRANNHDFTNKLHVILGLIQIGQYEKAISYIENISIIQRETLSVVMRSINNPTFQALLIGKIARASECNIKFILMENTHFDDADIALPSEALVTIVGNLIDNAIDAMNVQSNFDFSNIDSLNRKLQFGAFSKKDELLITVTDNGSGISQENKNHIFENGFSTKGSGRGVGLFHTKQLVESLGGTIYFESKSGSGTTFVVKF